jgi:DNA-binding CsgD family transcriptional regulator
MMQPVINAVRHKGNVLAAMEAIVRGFGFGEFLFGCTAAHHPGTGTTSKPLTRLTPVWGLSNAPIEWAQEYISEAYIEVDPRVQGVFTSALPVFSDQGLRGSSDRLDRFLDGASRYGILSGVSYLIPNPDRFGCIAAYSTDRPFLDDVTQALLLQHEGHLISFGTYCHEIFVRQMIRRGVPPLMPGVALTPREHDILRSLARGATNEDTATELGISERTVQAHVDAVRLKLNAATRTEAVILAEKAGLIDFRS